MIQGYRPQLSMWACERILADDVTPIEDRMIQEELERIRAWYRVAKDAEYRSMYQSLSWTKLGNIKEVRMVDAGRRTKSHSDW